MLGFEKREAEEAVARPDYGYVHDELRKVGVTLKLLWEEYSDECARDGKVAVSYVTFTRGYADYTISKNVTNHLKRGAAPLHGRGSRWRSTSSGRIAAQFPGWTCTRGRSR